MSSNIYRQADSRWSYLLYPSKPYTVGRSGCGLMSVLHCLMEQPKYCNYRPQDIVKFMRKYATRGNGTLWSGIMAGLKHWGYNPKQFSCNSMKPLWNELEKGNRIGVIRMLAPNKHSVKFKWTGSGHYICFVGYKKIGNKHYFKIKDSGRGNNGWFCYETKMRGMFGPAFVTKRILHDINGRYTGELPKTTLKLKSKGEDVKLLQRFINSVFKIDIKVDGKFGNVTDSWVCQFQVTNKLEEDGVVGPITLKAMEKYTNKKVV